MNDTHINNLIAHGESNFVEFISNQVSSKTIAEIVCSFLNGEGGRLIFGVSGTGQLKGLNNASSLVNQVKSELPELISPMTLWSVEEFNAAGKAVVVLNVPEGMDKPYVTAGAIYIRRAATVVTANRDEISSLILKNSQLSQRWERQFAWGADRNDLDYELIEETLHRAIASQRWKRSDQDVDAFLAAIGLMVDGNITNAAILLYGNEPSRFLPQARVRLLIIPDGKTGDRYEVDHLYECNLLRIAHDLSQSLLAHVGGVQSEFSQDDWRRVDKTRYPMTALREGIMNAIVHRDYESNGSTIISLFAKSLEISNPGGLPEELKLSDLRKEHSSRPRNPDIAHICYLHGLIEKVGRGTQRIIEDCRKAKLKTPKWTSSKLETTLTFFAGNAEHVTDLTARQSQIAELLSSHGHLKVSEIVERLDGPVTDRTVRNDLQVLIDNCLVKKNGNGPTTAYGPMGTSALSGKTTRR